MSTANTEKEFTIKFVTIGNVLIGMKVIIHLHYPQFRGHDYKFGKVIRKTPKTIDIQLVNVKHTNKSSIPIEYRADLIPDWEIPYKVVKAYCNKEGDFRYKRSYIEEFDSEENYACVQYFD